MKKLARILLAGAAVLAPVAGMAAIDGSHHDMSTYLSTAGTKCAYCHAVTVATAGSATLGSVGTFCAVVCHDALTINTAAIGGPGYMTATTLATTAGGTGLTVLTGSHGMTPGLMPAPDLSTAVDATNWPHTAETTMQCTSCHAVHDSTNPPFLNAPLATGANSGTTAAFCNKCHNAASTVTVSGRWENIANKGAHPTEFPIWPTGATALGQAGMTAASATKKARAIDFKAAIVKVVANGSATTRAELDALKQADAAYGWATGGHVMSLANNMPTTVSTAASTDKVMGCYTCHSAHQSASGVVGTNLILGQMNATHSGTSGASSIICIGCHGDEAAATAIWDAGITGYGHPANEGEASPY